jgi:hypothetical protein
MEEKTRLFLWGYVIGLITVLVYAHQGSDDAEA